MCLPPARAAPVLTKSLHPTTKRNSRSTSRLRSTTPSLTTQAMERNWVPARTSEGAANERIPSAARGPVEVPTSQSASAGILHMQVPLVPLLSLNFFLSLKCIPKLQLLQHCCLHLHVRPAGYRISDVVVALQQLCCFNSITHVLWTLLLGHYDSMSRATGRKPMIVPPPAPLPPGGYASSRNDSQSSLQSSQNSPLPHTMDRPPSQISNMGAPPPPSMTPNMAGKMMSNTAPPPPSLTQEPTGR